MTPVTLKIKPWFRKVNQFKILSMVTISENLKVIGEKLQEMSRKQCLGKTRTQTDADARRQTRRGWTRTDADTHLGDRKP